MLQPGSPVQVQLRPRRSSSSAARAVQALADALAAKPDSSCSAGKRQK
jgi:hypothetical protein